MRMGSGDGNGLVVMRFVRKPPFLGLSILT